VRGEILERRGASDPLGKKDLSALTPTILRVCKKTDHNSGSGGKESCGRCVKESALPGIFVLNIGVNGMFDSDRTSGFTDHEMTDSEGSRK
jgi:hypothetical protein